MSWCSIYSRVERDHRSTMVIVNFENMTPCSSVSTVDFEHVFIFWVWSFNISIVFRLRWIQVPFIYRKDFYKVKYLHEVACIAPCLIFFRNLFKISRLECSPFFRTPSVNYSGVIIQGKISLSPVLGRILGAVIQVVLFREELFMEKCSGSKVQGEIAPEGVSWESLV